MAVSASHVSHPRAAWPGCRWGWRVDWGHEDEFWGHPEAWLKPAVVTLPLQWKCSVGAIPVSHPGDLLSLVQS